jgi:2,3-bisphosphoglycerate-dependent phosphoglycerate mutase
VTVASDGGATDLVLIRHGETAWNRERRIQGQLDTPLNDEGLRQAQAAAKRLSEQRSGYRLDDPSAPASIVSSDLARCRETAGPIAAATGLPVSYDARLRERSYGLFQGRTYDEVRRDRADAWGRWLARDPDFDVEGGDSLRTFQRRVEAVLSELARAHLGRTLIVVTHGGVLDIACRMCRGMDLTAPRDFELLNASLNRIRWDGARFEIVDWGDVSHWSELQPGLDEVEPAEVTPAEVGPLQTVQSRL